MDYGVNGLEATVSLWVVVSDFCELKSRRDGSLHWGYGRDWEG